MNQDTSKSCVSYHSWIRSFTNLVSHFFFKNVFLLISCCVFHISHWHTGLLHSWIFTGFELSLSGKYSCLLHRGKVLEKVIFCPNDQEMQVLRRCISLPIRYQNLGLFGESLVKIVAEKMFRPRPPVRHCSCCSSLQRLDQAKKGERLHLVRRVNPNWNRFKQSCSEVMQRFTQNCAKFLSIFVLLKKNLVRGKMEDKGCIFATSLDNSQPNSQYGGSSDMSSDMVKILIVG